MPDSPTPSVFGYNAEATDYSTGMQYLRARYYDTGVQRFVQEDDYRGCFSEPQTMHRYIYVGNEPVNRIDSSGYFYYMGNQQVSTVKKPETATTKASNFYIDYYTNKANTPKVIHNIAEYQQYMYGKNNPTVAFDDGEIIVRNPYKYGPLWITLDTYNCMKDLEAGKEIDLGNYGKAASELGEIIEDALQYYDLVKGTSEEYKELKNAADMYSKYDTFYYQWADYYKNIEKFNEQVEMHEMLMEDYEVYEGVEPTGVYTDDTSLIFNVAGVLSIEGGHTTLYNLNTGQVSKYFHAGVSLGPSLSFLPTIQQSQGMVTDNVDNPKDYEELFLQWGAAALFGFSEAYGFDLGEFKFSNVNQISTVEQLLNASFGVDLSWYSLEYTQTINDEESEGD